MQFVYNQALEITAGDPKITGASPGAVTARDYAAMTIAIMFAMHVALAPTPVADAARFFLQVGAQNLIAAAEEMPADKYNFRATPRQMTFAHLMWHIAVSNRFMCAGISGVAQPKEAVVADTAGKDALVAAVKESFEYCESALSKVDDSALSDSVPLFHRTRANVMMILVADLADHYSLAATYLRLNGLLPPTAHREQDEHTNAKRP